jgi:hypothetical protein
VDKQQAYEAGQAQEALGMSDSASSPDLYSVTGFFDEMQQTSPYPAPSGPPPAAASYNPQYSDPTGASMESLQRTMAAAQASHPEFQNGFFAPDEIMSFQGSMVHESTEDRAQFPLPEPLATPYTETFPANFTSNIYNSPQSTSDLGFSSDDMANHTPMPYDHAASFHPESSESQATPFPSELIQQQFDGLPSLTHDSSESQSPQESNESHNSLDYTLDIFESEEGDELPLAPPAPSIPFKSPAPLDIASRRKVQKPTNLVSGNFRNRPSMGPRTVSHADGFRRGVESPLASPMRRIASAGGNRPTGGNVISGRICKPGVESAQRSPIVMGGFMDEATFERVKTFRRPGIRNPPSLTALSSLNSSLAPPTPMSPSGREMAFKRDGPASIASPHEGSMNSYIFNGSANGCFTAVESDQNLSSPPVTPHNQLVTPGSGWPNATDYQDRQWAFEVPDEPLYTPANENFHPELHMPQPQPLYINSMSQPISPEFALAQRFNTTDIYQQDTGSPQFKHESPQYTLSAQNNTEYSFPDAQGQYPHLLTSASAMAKQKTFQFSHTTQADFPKK